MFNYYVFEKRYQIQHFSSWKYIFDYFNPQKSHLFSSCNYHFIYLMFFKITLSIKSPFVVHFSKLVRRILKHGFACSETCYIDAVSWLRNIVYIWSLSKKDRAITKKKLVLHNSLLTSQWLHKFTTFIISNPSSLKTITLTYYSQIILHDFHASLTCVQESYYFSSQFKH